MTRIVVVAIPSMVVPSVPIAVPVAVVPSAVVAAIAVVVGVAPAVGTIVVRITPSPIVPVGIMPSVPVVGAVGVVWVAPPVIPRIVTVYNDIGVAAMGVVVIIVVDIAAGRRSETLETGCIVGIVIRFGCGIGHPVGIGYGFRGLICRLGIQLIVLAVGIVGLVIVLFVVADAGIDIRSVA